MAQRVVVHIGLMKSGTTFLQQRLDNNRPRLAQQGILFPGPSWSRHVRAVEDLMGLPERTLGSWDSVATEIEAFQGTAVLSMEYLAMARERAIGIIDRAFGAAELRVVVGVRDLGRTVPAMWQETLKNRSTRTFSAYVAGIREGERSTPGRRFWRQQDAGRIAARWARHLGPERVYVVTVPPAGASPDLLWHRFAEVAGIRDEPVWDEGVRPNESLGAASAAVMRRLNELTGDFSVQDYRRRAKIVGNHVLAAHRAREEPIGFAVPRWLRDEADRVRDELARSGARIVGSLDDLTPRDVAGGDPDAVDPAVQLEAAVAALDGVLRRVPRVRRFPDDAG